jgi:hypothetical protein
MDRKGPNFAKLQRRFFPDAAVGVWKVADEEGRPARQLL